MVVTVLTGAGDGEAHAGRVPRADASNLAQTTVGLTGQTGHAPTGDHTLGTVSLRGTEYVDALVLRTRLKLKRRRRGEFSCHKKNRQVSHFETL